MKSGDSSQSRLRTKVRSKKRRSKSENKGMGKCESSSESTSAKCYRAFANLSSALLEVWKTFPETVKTAVLIFILSSAAVFWTKQFSPSMPQPEPTKNGAVETAKSIDTSTIVKQLEGAPKTDAAASRVFKNKSTDQTREEITTIRDTSVDHVLGAQETLSRGNYAEAYRQFRTVADRLSDKDKQRINQYLQESARRYARGQFREAAYELQRAWVQYSLSPARVMKGV